MATEAVVPQAADAFRGFDAPVPPPPGEERRPRAPRTIRHSIGRAKVCSQWIGMECHHGCPRRWRADSNRRCLQWRGGPASSRWRSSPPPAGGTLSCTLYHIITTTLKATPGRALFPKLGETLLSAFRVTGWVPVGCLWNTHARHSPSIRSLRRGHVWPALAAPPVPREGRGVRSRFVTHPPTDRIIERICM